MTQIFEILTKIVTIICERIPTIGLVYLYVAIEVTVSEFLFKIYEKIVPISSLTHIYFSGCGILSIYQLGIAKCLQEKLIISKYKIYSTSSGFIPAAALAYSIPADQMLTQICDSIDGKYITQNEVYHATVKILQNNILSNNLNVNMASYDPMSYINKQNTCTAAICLRLEKSRLKTWLGTGYCIGSLFVQILVDFIRTMLFQLFRIFGVGGSNEKIFIHPFLWKIWSPLTLYPYYSKRYIKKLYDLGYSDAQTYLKYYELTKYGNKHY